MGACCNCLCQEVQGDKMKYGELSKIQQVALEITKGIKDLVFLNTDRQKEIIVKSFELAELWLKISEDPQKKWNGGTK